MSVLGGVVPGVLAIILLVGCSAFFSGTEVAMFALRRVDREQMMRSKTAPDSLIVRMLVRPRQLIATLLIGNELVNVSVSAVVAGMVPTWLPGGSELELALVATLVAVLLLLFLGEITPKTIAIKAPVGWARGAVRPLWLFSVVIAPIRAVVRLVVDLLMRPFGSSILQAMPRDLSEGEFKALVDASSAYGEVDVRERRLIHRVFEFDDKTVAQVMMPRQKIFALAYNLPTARLISEISTGGYSRVPIYQKSLDRIKGIIYAKDLVVQGTGLSAPRRLVDLLHEPLFVPRTTPIERLFRIFKQRKIHMAVVVNEYGKVVGLVTMEDLLEELFGEIYDEREHQKAAVCPATPPPGTLQAVGVGASEVAVAVAPEEPQPVMVTPVGDRSVPPVTPADGMPLPGPDERKETS